MSTYSPFHAIQNLTRRLRALLRKRVRANDNEAAPAVLPPQNDSVLDDDTAEMLRQPDYASLVKLRRAIARKRTELIPLLQACEAYGLPALARESGFPTYTLRLCPEVTHASP